MKRLPSITEQNRRNLHDLERMRSGKITFRTHRVLVPHEQLDAQAVKRIREDVLHVSQRILADSMGVSVRTVQGWECGRSRPFGAARRLLQLMEQSPVVRREVLPMCSDG